MLTSAQAGYSGSQSPTVSSSESWPSASSFRITAAAKDFEVLPMWKSVSWSTGGSSGARPTLPAKASIAGPGMAEADVGGDAGHLLDRRALGQPALERRLHARRLARRRLRGRRRAASARPAR